MRALRADLEAVDSDGEEESWARRPIADRCRHIPPVSLRPACLHLLACPHLPAMHHKLCSVEEAVCLFLVVRCTLTSAPASFHSLHALHTRIKAGSSRSIWIVQLQPGKLGKLRKLQ